ncbi:MAG: hypothetical protein LUD72_12515, partial [Bacteroidales bacterium]|nr:hypothetical protein [Bacteroidales bacterium]
LRYPTRVGGAAFINVGGQHRKRQGLSAETQLAPPDLWKRGTITLTRVGGNNADKHNKYD